MTREIIKNNHKFSYSYRVRTYFLCDSLQSRDSLRVYAFCRQFIFQLCKTLFQQIQLIHQADLDLDKQMKHG
jgi:hypothetical protein